MINILYIQFTGTIPSEWSSLGNLTDLKLGVLDLDCPVRDYRDFAENNDFVESYGNSGNQNCKSTGGGSSSSGLDGGAIAAIIIAVLIVLGVVIYFFVKRQRLGSNYAKL